MKTATVTDIEQFRRYRNDEDMPLGVLLSQLRREEPASPKMAAGTAFHAFLEWASEGDEVEAFERNGVSFTFALDQEIVLAPIREMRGSKTYTVNGQPFLVRGRVDMLDSIVYDHKLTARPFDAVAFADSYQWRIYLDIFGLDEFVYNVFVGKPNPKNESEWVIREFHPLRLFRYPELASDVQAELGRFMEFADTHLWTREAAA